MDRKELQNQVFQAYGLGYILWDKPFSRADYDKMVMGALGKISPSDRAQLAPLLVKFKRMVIKAFDMGRQDARRSPCPF
jgi:hypothetical protein